MRRALPIASLLTCALTARADEFGPAGQPYRGRVDFVFVGASLTDNTGLDNGVNCMKSAASTTVLQGQLPTRARLVAAKLYLAGSLIQDTEDYPGELIFTPPAGLRADNDADRPAIEQAAREAADRSVSFRPPGASTPVTVTADPADDPYVSVYYRAGATETGNVGFFLTTIDVTQIILGAGGGALAGDYRVSDLRADVCYGAEQTCSATPGVPRCAQTHANGAASFALLLVVEDLSLPQRSITVYEGLRALSSSGIEQRLTLSSPVSSPASGSLALYGLEGDLLFPENPEDGGPCLAGEYVEVDGDTDPAAGGLCLEDDDNPNENLFNGTINLQPRADPPPPPCTEDPAHQYRCCKGDGLCGVVGVDIDRFDISRALVPGVTEVRTRVHSGIDRFFLAALVIGVDVFEPTLAADTQIRLLTADAEGHVQLGGPIVYSIAVSNTGNVSATGVRVVMDAPPFTSGFSVLAVPAGATDASSATGGAAATGRVDVGGFDVAPGKVAEIRFAVTTECGLGRELRATATVSSLELPSFTVPAPVALPRGPGLDDTPCAGIDPDGPFAPAAPNRVLRGGGGCRAAGAASLLGLGALAALALGLRRRRGATIATFALALASSSPGCGSRHNPRNDEPPRAVTDLEGLPGVECGTPLMVVVTRADDSRFCIDRFEAGLDGGALGRAHQGDTDGAITDDDDEITTTDGTTIANAVAGLALAPGTGVSWYQAKAACANAGKRLCALAEWERACRGPAGRLYPYGDNHDEEACNGFFAYEHETPSRTGSYASCVSPFGVYDLSGNVEEWTETPVERVPGTGRLVDRGVRGGGYDANANALACAGPEFHARPGNGAPDRGFRCCRDSL